MTALDRARNASFRVKLLAALAAVYLIWGSTYLAIHLVMDTLPGFLATGLRFLVAGLLLVGYSAITGAPAPTPRQFFNGALTGLMLFFVGTGGVIWAASYLNSGLLALLVGMEPMILAMLLWVWPKGHRPSALTFGALALGFAGVATLALPNSDLGGAPLHLPSLLVITIGCISWAAGSLYGRGADMPQSGTWSSGIQILAGGIAIGIYGVARGELQAFDPEKVSWTSVGAFFYLVVFGSLVAFSAYNWLMRNCDPSLVATHNFVNPVVAVFLGWLLADEEVGTRTLIAALLIIVSVILATLSEQQRSRRETEQKNDKAAEDSRTDLVPANTACAAEAA